MPHGLEGYKQSPEHINKRVESKRGYRHNQETIEKIKRNTPPPYITEEGRKRIGEASKKFHENHPWAGEKNPRFKPRTTWRGYIRIYAPGHPQHGADNRVMEHRLVMEKTLGRYLDKNEVVHHKDGNKSNNDPGNLILTTREKHKLGQGVMYQEGYNAGFSHAFYLFFLSKAMKESESAVLQSAS